MHDPGSASAVLRTLSCSNNCICHDSCSSIDCFMGDVNATLDYGFDSIKLDGCGKEENIELCEHFTEIDCDSLNSNLHLRAMNSQSMTCSIRPLRSVVAGKACCLRMWVSSEV